MVVARNTWHEKPMGITFVVRTSGELNMGMSGSHFWRTSGTWKKKQKDHGYTSRNLCGKFVPMICYTDFNPSSTKKHKKESSFVHEHLGKRFEYVLSRIC